MTRAAILCYAIQFVVYSSLDLLAISIVDARWLRLNALIAAWGAVGALTKGRLESILIPAVALSGLMFASLMQGGAFFKLPSAILAVGASRLGNWLATSRTKPPSVSRKAARSTEPMALSSIRRSLVSSFIGAILGVLVFCVILLPFGLWISLAEALLLHAAIGSLGGCSRNLPMTSIWILVICGVRFGLTVDSVVYIGVAWLAMLAGRGGSLIAPIES